MANSASYRQEERVDRIYAQQWVFTINSSALEELWTGLGDGATHQAAAAGGGDKWLEEVTKALGLEWPLSDRQPGREEVLHGKKKRDVMDALFAFQDEIRLGNLTKVEAEMGGENWEVRKPKVLYPGLSFRGCGGPVGAALECHTDRHSVPSE